MVPASLEQPPASALPYARQRPAAQPRDERRNVALQRAAVAGRGAHEQHAVPGAGAAWRSTHFRAASRTVSSAARRRARRRCSMALGRAPSSVALRSSIVGTAPLDARTCRQTPAAIAADAPSITDCTTFAHPRPWRCGRRSASRPPGGGIRRPGRPRCADRAWSCRTGSSAAAARRGGRPAPRSQLDTDLGGAVAARDRSSRPPPR